MTQPRKRRSARPIWLGEDKREWDHIRLHIQLVKDRRVDAHMIAVYAGIAAHAEIGSGEAEPSADTLGGYACCDEKTARQATKRLEDLRYLAVIRRPGSSSIYRLLPPPPLPSAGGGPDLSENSAGTESEVSSPSAGVTPDLLDSPSAGVTPDLSAGAATAGTGPAVPSTAPPRAQDPTGPGTTPDELDRTNNHTPEGGDERPRPSAADIMRNVIPAGDDRLPQRFKGHLATRIHKLLGEGKFDPSVIEQAARRCIDHQRPDPALMDSLVVEILNEKSGRGANDRGPFQAPDDVAAYEGAIR